MLQFWSCSVLFLYFVSFPFLFNPWVSPSLYSFYFIKNIITFPTSIDNICFILQYFSVFLSFSFCFAYMKCFLLQQLLFPFSLFPMLTPFIHPAVSHKRPKLLLPQSKSESAYGSCFFFFYPLESFKHNFSFFLPISFFSLLAQRYFMCLFSWCVFCRIVWYYGGVADAAAAYLARSVLCLDDWLVGWLAACLSVCLLVYFVAML